MTTPFEVLGDLVNELRARRARGRRAAGLVRFLIENGIELAIAAQLFRAAFGRHFTNFLVLQSSSGEVDWDLLNARVEGDIDAACDTWMALPAFPDLASRRDREAFRSVARRRGINILVCALDPGRNVRGAAPSTSPVRAAGLDGPEPRRTTIPWRSSRSRSSAQS